MSDPGHWERVRARFHDLLERPPEEQAAGIRLMAAEDAPLAHEVASLLDALRAAGEARFADSGPLDAARIIGTSRGDLSRDAGMRSSEGSVTPPVSLAPTDRQDSRDSEAHHEASAPGAFGDRHERPAAGDASASSVTSTSVAARGNTSQEPSDEQPGRTFAAAASSNGGSNTDRADGANRANPSSASNADTNINTDTTDTDTEGAAAAVDLGDGRAPNIADATRTASAASSSDAPSAASAASAAIPARSESPERDGSAVNQRASAGAGVVELAIEGSTESAAEGAVDSAVEITAAAPVARAGEFARAENAANPAAAIRGLAPQALPLALPQAPSSQTPSSPSPRRDSIDLPFDEAPAPSLPRLRAGDRLGVFEILGPAGRGGMGEVYKARDLRLDRLVAIKVVAGRRGGDPRARERFEREARAISRLSHPHICTLHDVGSATAAGEPDVPFLVMEFLEGRTLADRLTDGRLPPPDALRYAIAIVDALAAAHAQGIVHRDLKPANIMLTEGGVKLLDFGLAQLRASAVAVPRGGPAFSAQSSLSAHGFILGTLRYMSPEQLRGEPTDHRCDIFACGVVLHEMLAGRAPFDARDDASVIASVLTGEPPALILRDARLAQHCTRIIRRCLEKQPDRRWSRMESLRVALRDTLDACQPTPAAQARELVASVAQIARSSALAFLDAHGVRGHAPQAAADEQQANGARGSSGLNDVNGRRDANRERRASGDGRGNGVPVLPGGAVSRRSETAITSGADDGDDAYDGDAYDGDADDDAGESHVVDAGYDHGRAADRHAVVRHAADPHAAERHAADRSAAARGAVARNVAARNVAARDAGDRDVNASVGNGRDGGLRNRDDRNQGYRQKDALDGAGDRDVDDRVAGGRDFDDRDVDGRDTDDRVAQAPYSAHAAGVVHAAQAAQIVRDARDGRVPAPAVGLRNRLAATGRADANNSFAPRPRGDGRAASMTPSVVSAASTANVSARSGTSADRPGAAAHRPDRADRSDRREHYEHHQRREHRELQDRAERSDRNDRGDRGGRVAPASAAAAHGYQESSGRLAPGAHDEHPFDGQTRDERVRAAAVPASSFAVRVLLALFALLVAIGTAGLRVLRVITNWRVVRAAVGLLVTVAACIALFHLLRAPNPAASQMSAVRVAIIPPDGVRFEVVQISPDGRRIAFTGWTPEGSRLWIRALDAPEPRIVAGTLGAHGPLIWSPDSRLLAFMMNGRLLALDTVGGGTRTIAEIGRPLTGTWSVDDVILFDAGKSTREGLWRVPANGLGTPTQVRRPDPAQGEAAFLYPHFLPDGKHFLYAVQSVDPQRAGVFLGSLKDGRRQRVLERPSPAIYVASGHLLFLRDDAVIAQGFDPNSGALHGDPMPIVPAPATLDRWRRLLASDGGTVTLFSASQTGTIVHSANTPDTEQLAWHDRSGRRLQAVGEPGTYAGFSLSRDDTRVVATRTDGERRPWNLWMLDLARGTSTRMTFAEHDQFDPRWAPDGRHLAVSIATTPRGSNGMDSDLPVTNVGPKALAAIALDGRERALYHDPTRSLSIDDWSPDGSTLLYHVDLDRELLAVPATGAQTPRVIWKSPSASAPDQARFSPDGRWVAYHAQESGRPEVYVTRYPEGGERWQISTAGGVQPMWRSDGRELFFLGLDARMFAVSLGPRGRFEPGTPRPLFQTTIGPSPYTEQYAVDRVGARFLLLEPDPRAAAPVIDVVLNWTAARQTALMP